MLGQIGRKRLLLPLPFGVARVIATLAQIMPKPLLTPDQVILLKSDNIVGEGAQDLSELDVKPTPIETILPDYLARFRPSGKAS